MYTLYGAIASPYSIKMRAILRYRRLPFVWKDGEETLAALANVRTPVIPVLQTPAGKFANDSTPLLYMLEDTHKDRSIVPPDPAMAFVAHLIEDFADEWLTKAMFGYRWLEQIDQNVMSNWLAFDRMKSGGAEAIQAEASKFRDRQVGRMPLVGCTHANFALIEASTKAVLAALEEQVTKRFFLFGNRPSLAEFGILGQFSQLAVDPTPLAMIREEFPYTARWLAHAEDWSGVEGKDWDETPSDAALAILGVAEEVYAPFLAANAAAIKEGADTLSFSALGHSFSQPVFKYQAKCLADLRTRYAALTETNRARVECWIGTGWNKLLG
ncbi:glutathione S-transferase [uncultured Erythrobacter sp.]|uniref:glutathione S-transferase n=1 Tax=uncultured Erythrobacter sp. TaxID=263913 RepID=UPI00261B6A92|nr:glutathione S-transferase [uncultured Erythrobacter sp.]